MEMKKYKLGELMDVTRGQSLSGEYYSKSGNLVRLTLGNFDYHNNCFKDDKSKDNLYFTGSVKKEFILKKDDIITPPNGTGYWFTWFNSKNSMQWKVYSKSGCCTYKV